MRSDPLALPLFALVLHPVVHRLKTDVLFLLANRWFRDDGLLAGKKEEIIQGADVLLEEDPVRGPHLSTEISVSGSSKSALWCLAILTEDEDPLGRVIKPVTESGFTHLSAAMDSEGFIVGEIAARVLNVKSLIKK